MILDALVSSARYEALGPRFAKAFAWLRSVDAQALPEGKVVLEGDDLFVLVFRDKTKPLADVPWEAHRQYADIQYVAAGTEDMRWQALELTQTGEYIPEKDFVPVQTDLWCDFQVPQGQFVVFFPEDAHRPGIRVEGSSPVLKLVVKVRLPRHVLED